MKHARSLLVGLLLAGAVSVSFAGGAKEGATEIDAIKKAGVLKVGVKVDVPKFGYKDPSSGTIDGLEIDIARAMASEILGDPSKVSFQGVTAKTRGPLLDSGELDMVIATFTITEERKLSYNFTEPYFTDGVALLVKKDSGYKVLKDLAGKTIGVAQSATTKKSLEAVASGDGYQLKFAEFASYPEIKTALESGRVDAFSVDAAILAGYVDPNTVILSERFSPQQYGAATKLANKALADLANKKIAQMKADGSLQKLLDKWELK